MPQSAGELINKIKTRHVFADWTRQKQAAQLGLKTPLRIESYNGGTNPSSLYGLAVEGAAFTSAAEEQSYINEVNAFLPPVTPTIESGDVMWAISSSNSYPVGGTAITVDNDRNIYATGTFQRTFTINQYSTGPVNEGPVGLSAYGTLTSISNSTDTYIIKYNSSGQVLWATSIGGTNTDASSSITTDNNGNVYVTGYYTNNTLTIKQYDTPPIDGGSVGLSTYGTLANIGNTDVFIIKYNSSGQVLWATNCSSVSFEYGSSIAVDSSGNICIAGRYADTLTINQYDTPPSGGGSIGVSIYGTLTYYGSLDTFLIKYNSSGQVLWATSCNSTDYDQNDSLAIDADDNIYISGYYAQDLNIQEYSTPPVSGGTVGLSIYGTLTANVGNVDLYLIKYNPSGQVLWATSCGGLGSDGAIFIAIDNNNNVCVTGNFQQTITINQYDTPPVGGGAVGLSAYGTLISSGINDILILKYNSSGQVLWATSVGGTNNDQVRSIATDQNGYIYITGVYQETITVNQYDTPPVSGGSVGLIPYGTLTSNGSNDIFIIKYNSSGLISWATTCGSTGFDVGSSIVTDNDNNVYLTGTYINTMYINQFSSAPLPPSPNPNPISVSLYGTLTSNLVLSMFVIKYKG